MEQLPSPLDRPGADPDAVRRTGPDTHRRVRRPPARALAATLAATLAAALAACSQVESTVVDPPTPVRTATATRGPATPPISATGQVASQDEMRLSFKLGGVVRRIAVQPGDEVKRGQRLAEIELAEVGAQVEQARQLAAKAQRDLERGERLHADQVISLEQLQDLRTQASVAAAACAPRSSTSASRPSSPRATASCCGGWSRSASRSRPAPPCSSSARATAAMS
jgi:multidrug efflux pump subunit AcrA (membrane-fusion protein)